VVFFSSADYRSSARAHVARRDDRVWKVRPKLEQVEDWRAYPAAGLDPTDLEMVGRHLRSERPPGSRYFVESLETRTGRVPAPRVQQ